MLLQIIALAQLAIVRAEAGESSDEGSLEAQDPSQIQAMPQFEPGQNGVFYDGSALAALNGQLPPFDSRFPVVDQGYLVPILVDENEDMSAFAQYQWLGPAAPAPGSLDQQRNTDQEA